MASPIAVAMATDASARQTSAPVRRNPVASDSRPYCAGKSFVGTTSTTAPCASFISRLTRLSRSRERTDRPPVALPTTI